MNYKDDLRRLLEDLRDLMSDLEADDELEWQKVNDVISLLSEAESGMEDALKRL